MTVATVEKTMLYCPKCRRTYQPESQRFCPDDGIRLLSAPSAEKTGQPKSGVFTSLLGKTSSNRSDTDNKPSTTPRFKPKNGKTEEPLFPTVSRIFQPEEEIETQKVFEPLSEAEKPKEPTTAIEDEPQNGRIDPPLELKEKITEQKPLPRIIRPGEIPSGTASVGDRKLHPAGRERLTRETPEVLFGHSVKGRYFIIEKLEQSEEIVTYLAEDRIHENKKVIVQVLWEEDFEDEFTEKIFAEERVSLAHLKHPNIAAVFDSGELPEGNEFIVSEFVEGKSLKEILQRTGQFNALRTARIIRQTSYALSEAHQNGVLHRNLKPENIILTISEAGIEQVKLLNFGLSPNDFGPETLVYKSPEEIESGISTFASDIYSLAVIAYQMLTARLPFNGSTEAEMLKLSRAGLSLTPSNFRLDVSPLADQILEKALAYNPADRYPKARDFGEAFFNALTTASPWENDDQTKEEIEIVTEKLRSPEMIVIQPLKAPEKISPDSAVVSDIQIPSSEVFDESETEELENGDKLAWEKRSPEPPQTKISTWAWLSVAGVAVLLAAVWAISTFLPNHPTAPVTPNVEEANVVGADNTSPEDSSNMDIETPPLSRQLKQPENTVVFQNSKENMNEELAKNFLPFHVFYPKDWTKNLVENNFLDISKKSPDGLPIEQMLVTNYESKGTFSWDRENFPKLVEKSNQDLKKWLGDGYTVIGKGETTIQSRWKVYEVRFQGSGEIKGKTVIIWGRRLWLPVQRPGMKNGFVITLLASSLSPDVKSVDDVGNKGELKEILANFEPDQN